MSKQHKSITALARAIGFTHSSLLNWRQQYPDAPAGLEEDEWRAFIAAHDLGSSRNRANRGMEDLKRRKLVAETRRLNLQNARLEGRTLDTAEVNDFLLHLSARWKANVYMRFVQELAPKLAGLEPAQIRRLMEESADGLITTLQNTLDDWRKEQDAKPKPEPEEEGDDD